MPSRSNSLDSIIFHCMRKRRDVMLRQGKAHERRDAEVKHLREHRDAEPDKARHIEST